MLAWTVLAAFAAMWVIYKAQESAGRRYDDRTERLRMLADNFYAAAEKMLQNEHLDRRHLGLLRVLAESIDERGSGARWARGLRQLCTQRRQSRNSSPRSAEVQFPDRSLMRDFRDVAEAAFLLIAEKSIIFGPMIRRSLAEIKASTRNGQDKEASAFETIFDDCMPHVA